ncbi:MAG: precorrin-3B C(17)-methyltransferase [Methanoregula sp.]|uniref:precorrin-3B C(17)-methyltransferase n=1 Tax=Methanoregula sp. TaxID=2052170 RepID=UPI0025FCA0CF|nr:precorrin-3B C(17)-methyltransferase [Methanoregula sp.]MCK9630958.1 precorrin-3B C(17)-methyltransferase [Methanoregula sp.]
MPSHVKGEKGTLAIVGLGPGLLEYITPRAMKAVAKAEYVLGHSTYLKPLEPLLAGKQVISSTMGKEVDRAKKAIELARTNHVAIVSGGDAGVYGMASIVLEVLEREGVDIPVEVVPGVTAANAAASRVGSPLSGDFAVISLSDLLTPLDVIEQRLDAVFTLGIPVVLYNPKSRGRPDNLALAIGIARKHLGPGTPVGIVKNALREDEKTLVTTLGAMEQSMDAVDMHTTVIIGGTESRIWRMRDDVKGIITPRGYHRKYVY